MGHFNGKFEKDLKKIIKRAKGREGRFYKIFNKYGFYDVNDQNNGLTPEQRAQVPPENQTRFTQFANAIAEMILFVLGDDESGMMTKSAQSTVDDLDVSTQMANSQLDIMGASMASLMSTPVLPAGAGGAVKTAMEAMKSIMGAIQGVSYYNVNILPQFSFGLDGFGKLGDLGNILKPGALRPNWIFLYENERVKSSKFFATDNGKLKIGTNIDVSEGNELYLKKLFNVVTSDKNLNIVGDMLGGLSQQDFNAVIKASKTDISALDPKSANYDKGIANLKLNEIQLRATFNQYVEMKLWNIIKNRKNWAHGHWGWLTHNSMPEPVKTAVCSYIWTNGFALEVKKSQESALISYLGHVGLSYLTGFQYPIKVYGFAGDENLDFEGDKGIIPSVAENAISEFIGDSSGEINQEASDFVGRVIYFDSPDEATSDSNVTALPKNERIARRYFIWIADVLTRLTYNSLPDGEAQQLRHRRIQEANLIYNYFGLPVIEYGQEVSKLPFEHTSAGLKQRKFHELMDAVKLKDGRVIESANSFWRYGNEGSPGGSGSNGELENQESSATLIYGRNAKRAPEGEREDIEDYLKGLMDSAKVGKLTITSTERDPVNQARIMFNNLNRNNVIQYRAPGAAITQRYFTEKQKLGYGRTQPVTNESHKRDIKARMVSEISKWGAQNVSRHCADVNDSDQPRVFDIDPNSIKAAGGIFDPKSRTRFKNIIEREVGDKKITKFLHPGNSQDKAYHIEIPQSTVWATSANKDLPKEGFALTNTSFIKGGDAWMVPLSNDYLHVSGIKEEDE